MYPVLVFERHHLLKVRDENFQSHHCPPTACLIRNRERERERENEKEKEKERERECEREKSVGKTMNRVQKN